MDLKIELATLEEVEEHTNLTPKDIKKYWSLWKRLFKITYKNKATYFTPDKCISDICDHMKKANGEI